MESEIKALMQEGNQYLKAQNLSDAKKNYLEVISKTDTESEAFYGLGWISYKEQKAQEACDYLSKACSLDPLNKNYLQGLSEIYLQLGELQAAIKLFQAYLKEKPSDVDVYLKYAFTLAKNKETDLSIQALKQCIELNPKELAAYMSLGELLYHLMQYREAQAVYIDALNNDLKSEGLYKNISKLHIDFGELDQAKVVLENAINCFPDSLVFPYRLSSLDKSVLSPELFNKLSHQDPNSAAPDKQFYHYWLLSKYAEKEYEPILEMEYLAKAHEVYIKTTAFPYDADHYLKELKQASLTVKEKFEPLKNVQPSELSPIFIVGVPRCGSTLIENIICSGPEQIIKGEESSVISHVVMENLGKDDSDFWLNFQNQSNENFQRNGLLKENLRFTDKSLENIFLIDFILALYPKAKIIYCERTPLASIVSILKNNMVSLPWAHKLEDILQYVENSQKAIEKYTEEYPASIYKIKYEDLVTNPEDESKKLMAFCDLEWNESCLSFHNKNDLISKTASHIQIRKKINQNSLYHYKSYEPFFFDAKQHYTWL